MTSGRCGPAVRAASVGFWLLCLIPLCYLAVISYTLAKYHHRADSGLRPSVLEFTPTYGASLQLRDLPPESLYERDPTLEYTKRTLPEMYPDLNPIWRDSVRYPPWLYPPHFIFFVVPLALLPFWGAYALWILATAVPYLAAMRRILPSRLSLPLALAFPPVFYNAFQAQTGFLTAGFIGLGLHYLKERPVLAGLCLGAASVKPHFGLLIPIALVAGGYWRATASAVLTVVALALASAVAFGPASWTAFIGSADVNLRGFEASTYNFMPMTTMLSTFSMAGFSMQAARIAQFVAFVLMMSLVAAVWWHGRQRPGTLGLQSAVLCIAAPLAIPMAYIYDLVLLAPAVAWIGLDLQGRGAKPAEWLMLIVGSASLLAVVTVAHQFQLQMGPILLAGLLALALRRYFSASAMTDLRPVQT